MKTFMDGVEFNDVGNAVTLLKQGRQPSGDAPQR